ncbi:isochorismate synthase [Bifidobacterium sp. ESL0728]|uniref:isochorismate synthase n=1 Tax=Bifidobacterium sp. ESL0728 TaxID=2983220 RepID=UPI0023F652E6|nr:isochorismate synthase [Bifidobacterium sp. ESL0728]WEV59855.1 isochorismate synthase [Bifidobacterium sp. ESL0728]
MATILKVKTIKLKETLQTTQVMHWLQQQTGPVFAWEDPARTQRLFASGVALQPPVSKLTFAAARQWFQNLSQQLILTPSSSWHDVKAVGSFLFDEADGRTQNWGPLSGGLLFVPHILVHYQKQQWRLTLIDADSSAIDQLGQELKNQPALPAQQGCIDAYHEINPQAWTHSVQQALDCIHQHQLAKVVLARTAQAHVQQSVPESLWLQLRQQHPHIYHILLRDHDTSFISATPERLVRMQPQRLLTGALAGTTQRTGNLSTDQALAQQLLHDDKNLAEHKLVVDWLDQRLRALGLRVSHEAQPRILATANLQHLYTPIVARGLYDPLKVLAALHPTPALAGTPQRLAQKIIRQLEPQSRGLYGAPVGYLSLDQEGEWAVGIRSGLLTDQELTLWGGAGIVKASQPASELQETTHKLQSLLSIFQIKD